MSPNSTLAVMRLTSFAHDAGGGVFHRFNRQGAGIAADLSFVCLWTAFGIAATVVFVLGFGVDVGQALAVAG
jgi:hypothetical protein